MKKERILVVEDADTLREVLTSVLEAEGYEVDSFATAEQALEAFRTHSYACVLSDFKLPQKNGIELLRDIRLENSNVPFLIMTAFGSIDIAVTAMKEGANDFITKPFEPIQLCTVIAEVIEHRRIINRSLGKETKRVRKFLTEDPLTLKVLHQAKKVARVDSSLLLLGESGTGKELIARYVHEHSLRADKPFVAINCAALPEDLLESEFFGHVAGSFTGATQDRIGVFELASDGTVFLDEIGDMPPSLQVKLLRALQEREIKPVGGNKPRKVNPRIIAATNVNVEEAMDSGKMREDFYYRIAVVTLNIPPLRQRPSDLLSLAQYFIEYFCSTIGRDKLALSKEAADLIKKYPWPGNARELENVIERAVILAEGSIKPEHLGLTMNFDYRALNETTLTLPEIAQAATRRAEIDIIDKVLRQTSGNKSQAARVLGVSYKTLLNKIKDYEISY